MLYLPPHIAHDGVAEGECMTCSIGFRAPSASELTAQFLYHLAERAGRPRRKPAALYRDPKQARRRTSGRTAGLPVEKGWRDPCSH